MKNKRPVEPSPEALFLYRRGRMLLEAPKGPKIRKRKKKAYPQQPPGYYNQTKDFRHIHPRSLR